MSWPMASQSQCGVHPLLPACSPADASLSVLCVKFCDPRCLCSVCSLEHFQEAECQPLCISRLSKCCILPVSHEHREPYRPVMQCPDSSGSGYGWQRLTAKITFVMIWGALQTYWPLSCARAPIISKVQV